MTPANPFTTGPRHGQVAVSFPAARFLPVQLAGGGVTPVVVSSPASFSPGRILLSKRGQARGTHARRFQLQRDALAVPSTSSAPPSAHPNYEDALWKSLTGRTVSLAANTGVTP
jgi:hypothetical protein